MFYIQGDGEVDVDTVAANCVDLTPKCTLAQCKRKKNEEKSKNERTKQGQSSQTRDKNVP